jgi:hypothetical protein
VCRPRDLSDTGGLPRKFISSHQGELKERGNLHPNAENIRVSNLVRCVECCADMCRECFADHLRFDVGAIEGGETEAAEEVDEMDLEDNDDLPPLEDIPPEDMFADAEEEEVVEEEE